MCSDYVDKYVSIALEMLLGGEVLTSNVEIQGPQAELQCRQAVEELDVQADKCLQYESDRCGCGSAPHIC